MAKYIENVTNADYFANGNKIKTPFATIIVGGSVDKPCYSILWWDEADKECNIGFSSYYLDFVFQWLAEEFEIVDKVEDVAPVLHGRWDGEKDYGEFRAVKCTACGGILLVKWSTRLSEYNYCPNCGAHMKDGE